MVVIEMTGDVLSLAELETRFSGEWVLLEEPERAGPNDSPWTAS
jgi:hypothetical protein